MWRNYLISKVGFVDYRTRWSELRNRSMRFWISFYLTGIMQGMLREFKLTFSTLRTLLSDVLNNILY